MVRVALGTGFFIATVACTANGDLRAEPTSSKQEAVIPRPAAMAPVRPNDNLDGFEQSLKRRFDRSRVVARELPGGGVLHVPNGHADHVAILVKGSDGKLRRECVSSAAEVATVMERLREGGNP
jgi:hypothetical protein